MLTGLERYSSSEVVGHREGDRHGVFGEALDRGDGEGVEAGPVARGAGAAGLVVVTSVIQMALNSSKGSRHALHRRSALHAVEPKWAISVVSVEPQRGQATTWRLRLTGTGPRDSPPRPVRAGRCRTAATPPGPVSHPVGRPRRRQQRADVGGIPLTVGLEDDAGGDRLHGGAPAVGGGDRHDDRARLLVDLDGTKDPEVGDADDRHLGVGDARDRLATAEWTATAVTTSRRGASARCAASRRAGSPSASSARRRGRHASATATRRAAPASPGRRPRDACHHGIVQARRQHPDAAPGRLDRGLVVVEELGEVGQDAFECGLHPAARLRGAVTETDDPQRGVVEVVAHLLERLAGDPGDEVVARTGERGVQLDLVGGEPQQPGHLVCEVPALLLDEVHVAPVALVAQHRVVVLAAAGAVDRADVRVERAGLAEQVEGDVAQGHVLLDLRGVRHPLRESLRVDHGVVGEAEHVGRPGPRPTGRSRRPRAAPGRTRTGVGGFTGAHRYSTSSGTS